MGRPRAYEGTEPYVFVSYSHRDEARVWPMIEGLQSRGVRVWYDGGIEAGSNWDDEIFRHLDGSSHILAFVTENFLGSENCMDEIHFAKENQKGPMLLYLDRLELPKKLQYRYGRLQALILPQFGSTDDFLDALCRSRLLSNCRGSSIQQSAPAYQVPHNTEVDPEEANRKGIAYFRQQNYTEAIKWFLIAATLGHPQAQYNLGISYEYGRGTAQDYAQAVWWYRKAAEQGFADGQNNLGTCYLYGEGIGEDKAKAVYWFQKAAEQGFARAQYNLGVCYDYGHGVAQNHAEAVKWFRKAAEQGHARSQETLKSKGIAW